MVWRAMLTPSRSDLVSPREVLHLTQIYIQSTRLLVHSLQCNRAFFRDLRVLLHRKDFEMTGILTSIIMILLCFKRIVLTPLWILHLLSDTRYVTIPYVPWHHDQVGLDGLLYPARTAEDEQTLKERHQPWPNIHRGTCLLAPQKSWSLLPFLKGSMLRFTSCKTAELFEV